jgi:hypothetical protein
MRTASGASTLSRSRRACHGLAASNALALGRFLLAGARSEKGLRRLRSRRQCIPTRTDGLRSRPAGQVSTNQVTLEMNEAALRRSPLKRRWNLDATTVPLPRGKQQPESIEFGAWRQIAHANLHAFIANVDVWPNDELAHLVRRFSAERAMKHGAPPVEPHHRKLIRPIQKNSTQRAPSECLLRVIRRHSPGPMVS